MNRISWNTVAVVVALAMILLGIIVVELTEPAVSSLFPDPTPTVERTIDFRLK